MSSSRDRHIATPPIDMVQLGPGLAVVDRELRYIEINERLAALNGAPIADHIGRTVAEMIPQFAQQIVPLLINVLATGVPVVDVELVDSTDPSNRLPGWWRGSFYPIQGRGSTIMGIDVVVHTLPGVPQVVGQRLHALRELAEANIIGILQADLDHISDANDYFLRMIGYTREELRAGLINCRMITPAEYIGRDQQSIQELIEHGVCTPFEKTYIAKDGHRVPIMLGATLLSREPLCWAGFVIDLTETKRAQAAAQAAGWRATFLADASAVLASSLDYATTIETVVHLAVPTFVDQCLVYLNQPDETIVRVAVANRDATQDAYMQHMLRNSEIDRDGQHPAARVIASGEMLRNPPIIDEKLQPLVASTPDVERLRTLVPRDHLVLPLKARGQVLGAISLGRFAEGQEFDAGDLALAQTLAERMAVAIDNARLYQITQMALELRDSFLSIASHELKTPLSVLLGSTDLLLRRIGRLDPAPLPERDMRLLKVISQQGGRLQRLVESLLDYSRIDSGQLTLERHVLELDGLTQRIVDDTLAMMETHVVAYSAKVAPLNIVGDELRLEQVIQNLVQNAMKYSPKGSRIDIQLDQNGDDAVLSIRDAGIGIPAAELPRLFDRFFRASNTRQLKVRGLGIGLEVVREIVDLHGGRIEVDSVEGLGTTFMIHLPLVVRSSA